MFVGRHYHRLEAKHRLSLPKALRGERAAFIITSGLDGGLFLFEVDRFAEELELLEKGQLTRKANRDFSRYLAGNAEEVQLDAQGRILIPEHLIKEAALKESVVIIGAGKRIEIWDQDRYHQYLDHLEPEIVTIAETLSNSL